MTDGSDIDCDTLLKRADMALYWAKANNPGDYCIFERGMEDSLRSRLAIEADLKRALVTEQLETFYQPVFNIATGALWGFEALIRWNHPDLGLMSPDEFIPLAEETGLIKSVGAWLVRRVCADMAMIPPPLKVAVNLSARQLEDDELIEDITEAFNCSGMKGGRFEFEITESTLLNNNTRSRLILLALRRMGATIALDDFGTGYSPLTYLTKFPLDKLKIDRSFISQMSTRRESAAIVRAIVELAHQLHMTTTAEGVETEEQLSLGHEGRMHERPGIFAGPAGAAGGGAEKPRFPARRDDRVCGAMGDTILRRRHRARPRNGGLIVQPCVRPHPRSHRPLLPRREQAGGSALDHHVHRLAQLGTRVLIREFLLGWTAPRHRMPRLGCRNAKRDRPDEG